MPCSRLLFAVTLGLCALGLALPQTAHAGRRPFTWVYDTEVLPERGVELETWITQFNQRTPKDSAVWLLMPVLGLTDRVELALPMNVLWQQAGGATKWTDYGAEMRIRFASPDKEEAGKIVPYLRFGVYQPLKATAPMRAEIDAVVSADVHSRVHLSVDVGAAFDRKGDEQAVVWGAAAAFAATDNLKLSIEHFGTKIVQTAAAAHGLAMAGPVIAYTHGRMWITFGGLYGLTDESAKQMTRLLWAVAW